jgi:carotenoid cleavage dioxygenase-like enzyme
MDMTATTQAASSRLTDHRLGFTTQDSEIRVDRLPVTGGELPAWLEGTLVRTGPSKFEAGSRKLNHWFDGLAMLHAFTVRGGKVGYASRFLESNAYKAVRDTGKLAYSEFATDPCRGLFKRVQAMWSPSLTDNGAVNVTRLGERYLSMTELPMAVEFDPHTLETLNIERLDDEGDGQITTAHPHLERASGALVNQTIKLGPKSEYRVWMRRGEDAERRIVGRLATKKPAYVHSFGLSERFVILVEGPLVVDPLRLATSGKPFIENYRWKPELGTKVTLFPIDGGEPIGPLETEPFFTFHHINAFERDGELVCDLCAFEDSSIIDSLYLDRLRAAERIPQSRAKRLRIPLDGKGAIVAEELADTGFELPRIDYRRRNQRPYRYAWGVTSQGVWLDEIVKIDTETGEVRSWSADGCFPGEPIFVPAPGESAEDEGVLLSVVLDSARQASSLVVLDARTLDEVARAEVPHHIPHSFHGQYFGGL